MEHLLLSKTGTLLSAVVSDLKSSNTNYSPLFSFEEGEITRCGAFWCAPNFDELGTPFTTRHGEYRKTIGTTLDGTHTKNIEGSWGSLSTNCVWEESETGLTSTLTLTPNSGETYIRPGFHPYFVFSTKSIVSLEGETLSFADIAHDKKMVFLCNGNTGEIKAKITTPKGAILLSFSASSLLSNDYSFSFCVWSDNKEKYICVEPVLGKGYLDNKLPAPFILQKGETLTLTASMIFLK